MKPKSDFENFLMEKWHWFAAGAGVSMLLAASVFAFLGFGVDPERAVADMLLDIGKRAARDTGVAAVQMEQYQAARKAFAAPTLVIEPSDAQASFLASGRRVYCENGDKAAKRKACGLPIPFGSKVCPLCGAVQPEEVKVVLDGDKDGLPDEYEKKYGLDPKNPADVNEDKDGDGFTNMEEFVAKTDPSDPDSELAWPPSGDAIWTAVKKALPERPDAASEGGDGAHARDDYPIFHVIPPGVITLPARRRCG